MTMKSIWTIVAGALIAMAFLGAAQTAQAQGCTLYEAAGQYGFILTGALITPSGPVPAAALGTPRLISAATRTRRFQGR
jgi:hypothetical protein